jgi:hypothetical protein
VREKLWPIFGQIFEIFALGVRASMGRKARIENSLGRFLPTYVSYIYVQKKVGVAARLFSGKMANHFYPGGSLKSRVYKYIILELDRLACA